MDLKDYREDLINEINAKVLAEKEHPVDVFILDYCRDVLVEDLQLCSDIETYNIISRPGTSPKFRNMHVDAAYLEPGTNSLTLVYCDYNDGEDTHINNESVDRKVHEMEGFVFNVFQHYFDNTADSAAETQLARDIIDNANDIFKLQLVIVSTNTMSNRAKKSWKLDSFNAAGHEFAVDLIVLDLQGIFDSYTKGSDRESIDFSTSKYNLPNGIPCIKANFESEDYDSYLCVVPGALLAKIYLEYNSRVLESNVRAYLNLRGNVNKGIMATILYDKTKFFAYNNGIAATADNITIVSNSKGTFITGFENFQIINGGQTTATLATAVKRNTDPYTDDKFSILDGIYVQMKLTIIKNKVNAQEIVRKISLYANTQNKVTNADLTSNHQFYITMENYSRKTITPQQPNTTIRPFWYFERARGQYDQEKMNLDTKAALTDFELRHPKDHKFTKTELAKYLSSADLYPHQVAMGADRCLVHFQNRLEADWDKNQANYNELYYKELIAKAIMFKRIDYLVKNSDSYKNNPAYKSAIVPYVFSKLVYEVNKLGKAINYLEIWNKQELPSYFEEDINEIIPLIFSIFYEPNRGVNNVGEWAKREKCWDEVKACKYEISYGLRSKLIDPNDLIEASIAARKDQNETISAASIIDIFNAGADYWNKVIQVGKQLNELNASEIGICEAAIKYINGKLTNLSKLQIKSLGKIMDKMKAWDVIPPNK